MKCSESHGWRPLQTREQDPNLKRIRCVSNQKFSKIGQDHCLKHIRCTSNQKWKQESEHAKQNQTIKTPMTHLKSKDNANFCNQISTMHLQIETQLTHFKSDCKMADNNEQNTRDIDKATKPNKNELTVLDFTKK